MTNQTGYRKIANYPRLYLTYNVSDVSIGGKHATEVSVNLHHVSHDCVIMVSESVTNHNERLAFDQAANLLVEQIKSAQGQKIISEHKPLPDMKSTPEVMRVSKPQAQLPDSKYTLGQPAWLRKIGAKKNTLAAAAASKPLEREIKPKPPLPDLLQNNFSPIINDLNTLATQLQSSKNETQQSLAPLVTSLGIEVGIGDVGRITRAYSKLCQATDANSLFGNKTLTAVENLINKAKETGANQAIS